MHINHKVHEDFPNAHKGTSVFFVRSWCSLWLRVFMKRFLTALPMTSLYKVLIFNDNKKTLFYSPIPKLWERPLSPSNFEGVSGAGRRGSLYTTLFFNLLFIRKFILKKFLYKLPRPAVRLGNPLLKVKRSLANRRPPLQKFEGELCHNARGGQCRQAAAVRVFSLRSKQACRPDFLFLFDQAKRKREKK